MKILVFDDSEIHRKTAALTLKGHELTIVGTYDEAQKALVSVTDYDRADKLLPDLLEKAGLGRDYDPYGKNKGAAAKYVEKYKNLQKESRRLATTHPSFDVVLTDLLVPASGQAQGGEGLDLVGQEMPLGATIALLAICAGVKNVAVVTDKNHHYHPASAALDHFRGCKAEGVNIMCTNSIWYTVVDESTGRAVDAEFLKTAEGLKKYPEIEGEWGKRKGLAAIKGKDWKKVLDDLFKKVDTV